MRKPVARPTGAKTAQQPADPRMPRAFAPPKKPQVVEYFEEAELEQFEEAIPAPRRSWLWRFVAATAGILVSLALGLALEQLIRDLFARYEWLGWAGLGILGLFVLALVALAFREALAIARLRKLDRLRAFAAATLISDKGADGHRVLTEAIGLYAHRADLARARLELMDLLPDMIDGADVVRAGERGLMGPLDLRARMLTAASARRVAIVTAISPRALVDIAFVAFESMRLARRIADLYGARPGLFGSWRLAVTILGHLAVTGGVALGDSLVQQLVGHGLAAKVSARLGEGVVNGLMTVRVGIAAMRVTRPLPFDAIKQPVVMDFLPELAKLATRETKGDGA